MATASDDYTQDACSYECCSQMGDEPERVNHPAHYNFGQFEVIDVAADDALLWQVLKYIARAKHKGQELTDLKKARFYLDRRIAKIESPDARE